MLIKHYKGAITVCFIPVWTRAVMLTFMYLVIGWFRFTLAEQCLFLFSGDSLACLSSLLARDVDTNQTPVPATSSESWCTC